MDLDGKSVLVLGLGISGRSAARFCAERGARVVAADERPLAAFGEAPAWPEGVELRIGQAFPCPADFDLTVPSPGVPAERYRATARRVCGDIELAGRALAVPIVAVTGTNGKSTCVRMIECMLRGCGYRAQAAGNLGTPALSLVGEALDVAILEVSSFQLESTERFRARVGVVLNIAPDHLDRHGDLGRYTEAKRRLLHAQTPHDVAVLGFDDPRVRAFERSTPARIAPFGLREPPREYTGGAWLDAGALLLRTAAGVERFSLDTVPVAGRHNHLNAAAALLSCEALGAQPRRAMAALRNYRGLPHRCEWVATRAGVDWFDDSKATNVAAAVTSLERFDRPVLWIAGGRDKGLDFDPLVAAATGRVRRALLIGEAAGRMQEVLAPRIECERLSSLEEAVRRARKHTKPGDVVLLAPACSSFDQFRSFEARGERFRHAIDALPDGEAAP